MQAVFNGNFREKRKNTFPKLLINMVKTAEKRIENKGEKFKKRLEKNFFLGKFKENSDFSLNLGKLCVTLQPELCPFGS